MSKQTITREAVREVLKDYFQQYKNNLFSTIITLLAPAVGTILIFFVPPLIIAKLVNIFIEQKEVSFKLAGVYIILFSGAWLLGEILWRVGSYFILKIKVNGINILSKKAFRLLSEQDHDFFTNNFVGTLTKKAMTFAREFDTFTETLGFNIATNVLPVLFAIIVLWNYSPWIPSFLLICLVLTTILVVPLIRKRSKLVALRHEAYSKMSGMLSDTITNMFAVKSFAKEKEELETFEKCVDELGVRYKNASDYNNLVLSSVVAPIYVVTNIVGLLLTIFFVQKLNLQAGTIIVVFSYYSHVTRFFWEIHRIYSHIESSISEGAEFIQLFLEKPLITDIAKAKNLKINQASISFNQVGFGYNESQTGEDAFLKNFNLEIKNNQKVGLVGPSGGGKTTITKLILRFIDPQTGNITIDGQDISKVTQNSLRQNIAYVPQDPLLFHRSLFENIAYGKEDATEEEVIHAAKLAHADEFISQLPNAYQTLVGERGIKLSGGQRQRVAIARAILKNSSILVLDEATSSLDSESEKYIQEGLWELMKNKTALVIAHRLSTIKHLDRIIVLDQGKIVQDGTHEELIKQAGIYAKLWSHQSGEFF